MSIYTEVIQNKNTPQSEPIPGRESEMAKNSAGGHTFTLDIWGRLERFLILGADSGTYYVEKRGHAKDNVKVVRDAVKVDGVRAIKMAVVISKSGRAPNNDPALLVLAVASVDGDEMVKRNAYQALPLVARIGTHLYHFADFRDAIGGWGNGMKRAVARWYTDQDINKVALQAIKYRQRDGWSHRDLLRLCHAVPKTEAQQALFAWITQGKVSAALPETVKGFIDIQKAEYLDDVIGLIESYGLPREAVPTQWLNYANVWESLLHAGKFGMPIGAMIRNLGKMTTVGLLTDGSDAARHVIQALHNETAIKYSRLHPLQALYAQATYGQGHGVRGSLTWCPVSEIVAAVENAFYTSFGNVEPTGKRSLLGIDVSGSMGMDWRGGVLKASQIAAAMAMVTARSEQPGDWTMRGFGNRDFFDLGIKSTDSLDQVLRKTKAPFGGTDCSLPMNWARDNGVEVDSFIIYTDNETWGGHRNHPSQALKEYRQAMGIPAKLVVVATEATEFTIADPKDAGMLDVVGFDANAPAVISNFLKG